ncbi:hypothetical protein COCON_G00080910 [Conger conger]|uniref:Uncharacterized protein n=1 Tax=Conger conger TaxID=82655 RepID=A0A9Q1DPM8_CONCO|nr:hypothetical protein COCON_G00080910 [Conger conger]
MVLQQQKGKSPRDGKLPPGSESQAVASCTESPLCVWTRSVLAASHRLRPWAMERGREKHPNLNPLQAAKRSRPGENTSTFKGAYFWAFLWSRRSLCSDKQKSLEANTWRSVGGGRNRKPDKLAEPPGERGEEKRIGEEEEEERKKE